MKKILKNPWFIGAFFFLIGLACYKGSIYIKTKGDYSPGYVEGNYQTGDHVARDKILVKTEGDIISGDKIKAKIQDSSDGVNIVIQDSDLKGSPIITNSPNTQVDNSVTVNKMLPEIKIGTIYSMVVTGTAPYKYSFKFDYKVLMDAPAKYKVEYINIDFYEIIRKEDESNMSIFLNSTRMVEPFNGFGMERKVSQVPIEFSANKRLRNLMIKLVMGVEGGLTREDSRTMWRFGGE